MLYIAINVECENWQVFDFIVFVCFLIRYPLHELLNSLYTCDKSNTHCQFVLISSITLVYITLHVN